MIKRNVEKNASRDAYLLSWSPRPHGGGLTRLSSAPRARHVNHLTKNSLDILVGQADPFTVTSNGEKH